MPQLLPALLAPLPSFTIQLAFYLHLTFPSFQQGISLFIQLVQLLSQLFFFEPKGSHCKC